MIMRPCWRNWRRMARLTAPPGGALPDASLRAPRPMTARSRTGWPAIKPASRCVLTGGACRNSATAKTRTRRRRSTRQDIHGPVLRVPRRFRESRCPTTISMIPTRHSNWRPNSANRPLPSSSTQTRAALPAGQRFMTPGTPRLPPTRSAPLAALSPPTGRLTPTPRAGSPESSPRWSSPPPRMMKRWRSLPKNRTFGFF